MYQITVENLSLVCQSQQAVQSWTEFFLDKGYTPKIKYIEGERG